jgi:hypothetical protein
VDPSAGGDTLCGGEGVLGHPRSNLEIFLFFKGAIAMKTVTGGSCAVLLALILMMDRHALNDAASCESLSSLSLPNTSITSAQMAPAGGFSLPGTGPAAAQQFSQSKRIGCDSSWRLVWRIAGVGRARTR